MPSVSKSRVDEAYRRLRTDILSGRHAPGSKLVASTLCEQYEISSGVLREVLPRLAGEGLAISEPQRGFRVTPVSEDDLRQLTEARSVIESVVLRQSMEYGGVKFEAGVIATHHTLMRTPAFDGSGSVNDDWLVAHGDYHRALLSGSPNLRLQAIASNLRDNSEVYRCWATQFGDEPGRDVAAEHTRIMEAVVSQDTDRAVEALVTHINNTTTILLRGRGVQPTLSEQYSASA
jgi:DNA-binding GntR family transcriptional regulator